MNAVVRKSQIIKLNMTTCCYMTYAKMHKCFVRIKQKLTGDANIVQVKLPGNITLCHIVPIHSDVNICGRILRPKHCCFFA